MLAVGDSGAEANRPHGALTEPIAAAVRCLVQNPSSVVYHDHAGSKKRRVWAHMGESLSWGSILSGVDVLLADIETERALLVLEIEETGCPPKTLLGDILGVALSDFVTVEGGNQRFAITPDTELWVCHVANPRGHQRARNEQVLQRLQKAWGELRPLPTIRLVAADSRDVLVKTTVAELHRRFPSDGAERRETTTAT